MLKRIIKRFKTKGNILAMTLIIGSTAGAVALSMYAITSSDVKISGQSEDSLLAYQAASAGVDLGLMYYKYNNNVQLSNDCEDTNDPSCADPTSLTGLPIRIYLDRLGCANTNTKDSRDLSIGKCLGIKVNGDITYEDAPTNPAQNLPSNERVVDLKIWYKDDHIGTGYQPTGDPTHPLKFDLNYQKPSAFKTNDGYDPSISRVVNQDNSYQIDGLEKVNSFQLHLRPKEWAKKRDEFMLANPGKKPEDRGVYDQFLYHDQLQNTFCNGQISNTDPSELTIPNTDWCAYYVMYVPALGVDDVDKLIGANPLKGLREPFNQIYSNGIQVQLHNSSAKTFVDSVRIRPINMDAQFAISDVHDFLCDTSPPSSPHCHLNIDTGITHIEVTGYYGGAKRKLESQIDRKTNAFLGIFDRALYVSEGDLAP